MTALSLMLQQYASKPQSHGRATRGPQKTLQPRATRDQLACRSHETAGAGFVVRRARVEDIPELAKMCSEAFVADAPEGGNSLIPEVKRHSQQALLAYADKTLKKQIEASFQVKHKAAKERRAFRLEAQAAAMRAELALLRGDSFGNLWPSLPDAIQQRAEKRRREQQHVMWLVACDASARGTHAPTRSQHDESSPQSAADTPADSRAAQQANVAGSNTELAPAASHGGPTEPTAESSRVNAEVFPSSSAASAEAKSGNDSATSYSGATLPPGAFSLGTGSSFAEGRSTAEGEPGEEHADHHTSSSIIGCAMVTLSAAEAVLPPPLPTRAPQRCYIGNMAVATPRRRQGVAKALLHACERVGESRIIARRWKYDSVWLHTETSNTSAQKLYMRAGYDRKRVDPWFYGRMRQVLLSKQLPQHRTKGWRDSTAAVQQSLVGGEQSIKSGAYVWRVRSGEQS